MSDVRSSKLKFKGEKTKKKRKRADADADADDAAPDGEPASARPRKRREDDAAPEAWVRPDAANEIRGPTFIIHPSEPAPVALTFVAARGKIVLAALDKDVKVEDGDAPTPAPPPGLLERVPTDVAQVWVTTRVAGNETVNFRTGSGDGKFMSCDKHGVVTADVDARGPQEEWTPVVLPDGMVAFMNVYEKYLSVDEVAGGQLGLRGDSDEVGFAERFWVKVQHKYKREAHEEERKKKMEAHIIEPDMDEAATNRQYQAWGAGRSVVSGQSKTDLKKARKEGKLAETLLDRRVKLKSDRFC